MAEHIRMKQVPGGTVSAVDDRILYDVNLSCGIIEGCEISYPGNNMIHINAGYGIIKGGLFEMDDHTIYVDYAEAGEVTGQVYLHFDPAAEDKLTIIYETTSSLHQMEQNEDCNYHNKVYEIQLCTFTATTTALLNVEQTWVRATGAVEVLDNLNEIMANTDPNKCAGALAVKQLNSKLPFSLGIDANGNYGYKKVGADTVYPFKSNVLKLVETTTWNPKAGATIIPKTKNWSFIWTTDLPSEARYHSIILVRTGKNTFENFSPLGHNITFNETTNTITAVTVASGGSTNVPVKVYAPA